MHEKLAMILGPEPTEGYYAYLLESVTEKICNYCNISALPDGLENTAVEMAAMLYRTNDMGTVSAVKEGDSSVNYAQQSFNDVVTDFRAQLNRYRRMAVCAEN